MSTHGISDDNADDFAITIAPWLSINNGEAGVAFYKAAFGAREAYRLQTGDKSVVVRLSVGCAEFWVSGGSFTNEDLAMPEEAPVRLILTVPDPEKVFARALSEGANEIFPVGEEHGWRLGTPGRSVRVSLGNRSTCRC